MLLCGKPKSKRRKGIGKKDETTHNARYSLQRKRRTGLIHQTKGLLTRRASRVDQDTDNPTEGREVGRKKSDQNQKPSAFTKAHRYAEKEGTDTRKKTWEKRHHKRGREARKNYRKIWIRVKVQTVGREEAVKNRSGQKRDKLGERGK